MYINSNIDEFERYKMARSRAIREKQLQNRVDHLEKELNNIKRILQEINSRIP